MDVEVSKLTCTTQWSLDATGHFILNLMSTSHGGGVAPGEILFRPTAGSTHLGVPLNKDQLIISCQDDGGHVLSALIHAGVIYPAYIEIKVGAHAFPKLYALCTLTPAGLNDASFNLTT